MTLRSALKLAVAVWLAGAAGAPALAADELPGKQSTPEELRLLHNFSKCLAERRTAAAHELLAMDYRSEEYREALIRLANWSTTCRPSGELKSGGILLAGGVAEHLLLARAGNRSLASLVAHDPSKPSFQARDDVEYMSLCVVRSAPDQVAALLATAPASSEEAEAMRAIAPQLGPCLSGTGSARLNRPALRSLLALAAYRLAELNAPTQLSSGNE